MCRFASETNPPFTMLILIWSSPPLLSSLPLLVEAWPRFLLSVVSKVVSSEGSVTGERLGRNSTGDLCPRPP